jgi:predicted DsbA family dithiol-disulfide isomerase
MSAQAPQDPSRTAPLTIDVVSDVVCPWCYIGQAQLDDAVGAWRERNAARPAPLVRWHPFQLNPSMPEGGMSRGLYLDEKFGSRAAYPVERLERAAETARVELHLERIARQPNTLRAHALLGVAAADDAGCGGTRQNVLARAMFRAYFVDGQDIGDLAVLRALGAEAGLPDDSVEAAFRPETLRATTAADKRVRDSGIDGVPFFVIGGKVAVSGAVGTEALLEAFGKLPDA